MSCATSFRVLGSFLALGGLLALVACGSSRAFESDDRPSRGGSTDGTFGEDGGDAPKGCRPNPANYDVPGNGCDDDGDGTVDNPPACDTGLAVTGNAEDFAKAIGLCAKASAKGYGLVSAKYTRGYQRTDAPQPEQHGILAKFGDVIKPREGGSLGVLSTGYAREYDGTGKEPFGGTVKQGNSLVFHGKDWFGFGVSVEGKEGNGVLPPAFPKPAAGCEQETATNDVISLELEIKAPANASGFKFDFNFYSGEWPAYICSPFNDGFIAYLTAKGFNGGKGDNISFDAAKNPVSVNNGFFDRCTPNFVTGCAPDSAKQSTAACPGGVSELSGTGFGIEGSWCGAYPDGTATKSVNGGATGWLTSQAPVQGGETFTLELMIWDTGDALLDSSVLVDNFSWVQGAVETSTVRPPR